MYFRRRNKLASYGQSDAVIAVMGIGRKPKEKSLSIGWSSDPSPLQGCTWPVSLADVNSWQKNAFQQSSALWRLLLTKMQTHLNENETTGKYIKSLIGRASMYNKHFFSSVYKLPLSVWWDIDTCLLWVTFLQSMIWTRTRCTWVVSVWRCLHPSFQKKQELQVIMPLLETERGQKSRE